MRNRIARGGLVVMLALAPFGAAACDREDRQDVREGVNDVEEGVDRLDSDGKDD